MTRGMLVTVLGRLAGIDTAKYPNSTFGDVAAGQYYAPYIEWAQQNGIVSGIGANKFAPEDNITREQMAAVLWHYAQYAGIKLPATKAYPAFADEADIAGYAQDAVAALVKAGIISGKPYNLLDPQGNATRAEVAAMLHRFITAANH
jgi:hypothetical protein